MAYLKDITSNLDPQAFPGATFELTGEVPAAQCSEAKIESEIGETFGAPVNTLEEVGKFIGYDLAGKIATITQSTGGNTGDFDIIISYPNVCDLVQDPGNGTNVHYYIHNGAELILTRDVPSFADFIHAAGYAYTIKGGKLYTDMPSDQLKHACTILFDPIT